MLLLRNLAYNAASDIQARAVHAAAAAAGAAYVPGSHSSARNAPLGARAPAPAGGALLVLQRPAGGRARRAAALAAAGHGAPGCRAGRGARAGWASRRARPRPGQGRRRPQLSHTSLPLLQLKQHAMYVVVNMASSTAAHKQAVMESGWPALLVQQLGCAAPQGGRAGLGAARWLGKLAALVAVRAAREGSCAALRRIPACLAAMLTCYAPVPPCVPSVQRRGRAGARGGGVGHHQPHLEVGGGWEGGWVCERRKLCCAVSLQRCSGWL